ncbi:MAG: hemolysin family protein [Rhodospirillaceae bacterium]|nr:hemolysin family protein [Rhodospirillaceae bacterium]
MLALEIAFVVLLTLLNGVLAMSELAVVSSRQSRLSALAKRGNRGARVALALAADPGRFLSTVQIGITLVGILAGAISGATLADRMGDWLDTLPGIAPRGDAIAIGVVVLAITYLSLIIGELVPKRIAMAHPERVAATVARPMKIVSIVAAPAVWLLKISTEAVLRLLKLDQQRPSQVSEDEVRAMIAEGTRIGVFVPQEREMIEGVLRLADRTVRSVMTLRNQIDWVDISADHETVAATLVDSPYSRLLVCHGSVDRALGIIQTKDALRRALRNRPIRLKEVMVPIVAVHESTPVLRLLDQFRHKRVHLLAVVDDYGVTEGIVTPTDILKAIAGNVPGLGEATSPQMTRREDGSWLVDGLMAIDEFEDRTGLVGVRGDGAYSTVGGFALHRLAHVPAPGDAFAFNGARFEVVDMDGRRIDKLLVSLPPQGEVSDENDG